MTQLRRPVARETSVTIREAGASRPLIVTLTPAGIEMRLKRCRKAYLLPYGSAWLRAAQLAADARRLERRAKRKAARKGQIAP